MTNRVSDWKDEFLRLFTSGSVDDFGKALELKRENMPRKLYRYRSLSKGSMQHRIGEIVCGELFLSHPNGLNDPFEVSSVLASNEPSGYMLDKEKFMVSFRESMLPADFERIFNSATWYDDLLTYVAIKSSPAERTEETKGAFRKAVMAAVEMANSHVNNVSRNMVRFACFSTSPDNLPMWHHYTDAHKGICLEYDTRNITEAYQLNMLYPVRYVERMPDVTNMLFRKEVPQFGFMEYLAMHKMIDWQYENEWRLIYDAGSWYFGPEDIPNDFWTQGKKIQFILPSKIIMGMNISSKHEELIRKYARIADVPVIKAKQTEYGLRVD